MNFMNLFTVYVLLTLYLANKRNYYAPIDIRPHYPLDGQGWGLIGDLTEFDLKNRPKGWGI